MHRGTARVEWRVMPIEPVSDPARKKSGSNVVPRLREGVALARTTLLPSEPTVRRTRLALVAAVVASIAGCAYVVTSSALWAFMVVIVGVPIVALPAFLLVGIARQAIAGGGRPDN